MMKKIVTMVIISLFIMTSFAALPCISATITGHKLNGTVAPDKDEAYSITWSTRGNPPLPPVMWTEDFYTFYISTPQDPDGDNVYYYIEWGDGTSSDWIGPYEPGETVAISHEWSDEGTYQIKVKAKDQDGKSKCAVYSLTLSSNLNFFGVEIGYVDIKYTFTIYWKDGCDCWIFIDWGDGTGEWLGPYEQPLLFSHAWSLPGEYVLRIKLKDIWGNESDWITLVITILTPNNNAPDAPVITGPINGKIWVWYEYNFSLSDPDGDSMSLRVDWGIGGPGKLHGPFVSGTVVPLKYSWRRRGTYTIRAQAIDIYGAESDWGYLEVTMLKNQISQSQSSSQQSSSIPGSKNTMGVISPVGRIAAVKSGVYDGSLSGYVTDPLMNPIEGALVRVHFHGTYEEDYSDENGYYHVTNIPICYCLKNATCSKEGYKTEWVLLGIVEDTTYDFILTPVNNPPDTPEMSGPVSPKIGIEYKYTIVTRDPDGDDVSYYIDWGDGTVMEWIGPFVSGEEVTVSHAWYESGYYLVRYKAKDHPYEAESEWGEFLIRVPPKNKVLAGSLFVQILQRLLNIR